MNRMSEDATHKKAPTCCSTQAQGVESIQPLTQTERAPLNRLLRGLNNHILQQALNSRLTNFFLKPFVEVLATKPRLGGLCNLQVSG